MYADPRQRRLPRVSLKTFLIVSLVLGAWTGTQLRWVHQRREAREWLAAQDKSWYAPSLTGAATEASAPWSLRFFGEDGVVGIGIDDTQNPEQMLYSVQELAELFPEARVDVSHDGQFLNAAQRH